MSKYFYSLGLMSGTSGDGVDASIIQSDGDTQYKVILDKYFEYSEEIYRELSDLRDKINNSNDLKKLTEETKTLEQKITLFHVRAVDKIVEDSKANIDFIGFHGQTIFHNAKEKISKQLGDGKLLSKLTKKTVIYNFRENDLKNGGVGAPLAPIFHKLLVNQYKIAQPVVILNLGGIANITHIRNDEIYSTDVGPGNCLIDQWIKKNSKKNYDINGSTAQSGKIDKKILNQALDEWISGFGDKLKNYKQNISYDTKDFDLSFVHGLSLEDGAATLTEYTVQILSKQINSIEHRGRIVVCGGGRKNNFLLKRISEEIMTESPVQTIDSFGVDGDFIESQAFAYLAIRSYTKKIITLPSTTGVKKPCLGGLISKN